MSEIIVKMNIVKIDDKHVKIKGGEYVGDIVRCKACKWLDKGENESCSWSMCTRHIGQYIDVNADDFCSYGERREPCLPSEIL